VLWDGGAAQELGDFVGEIVAVVLQQIIRFTSECGISQTSNVVDEDGVWDLSGAQWMDLVGLS